MRKRLLVTLGALAALGLAAGAVPAFTADSGTVSVSVTAQAPATPCLEFLDPPGTSVSFGTRPFSDAGTQSQAWGDVLPRFRNCSTAREQVSIQGSDATSGSGSLWRLESAVGCAAPTLDTYALAWEALNDAGQITKSPSIIGAALPGGDYSLALVINMPCEGSDGAGETFSSSITLTAVIP